MKTRWARLMARPGSQLTIGVVLVDPLVFVTGARAIIWTGSGSSQFGVGLKVVVETFSISVPKFVLRKNYEGLAVRLAPSLASHNQLIRPLSPFFWRDLSAIKLALTYHPRPLITVDFNNYDEQWSVDLAI